MSNKIETFQTLAATVLIKGIGLKDDRAEHANNQNRLSFLVLNILITGSNAEFKTLASSFTKDGGQFFPIRMVLTRAKAVAKALAQGPLSYQVRKETITATSDQVKAWDIESEIPFNVSTAYNSLTKEAPEKIISQDDLAIEAYCQAVGLTVEEFNQRVETGAIDKATAINQGNIILDDIAKAEKLQQAPKLAEYIRGALKELEEVDPQVYQDLMAQIAPKPAKQKQAA